MSRAWKNYPNLMNGPTHCPPSSAKEIILKASCTCTKVITSTMPMDMVPNLGSPSKALWHKLDCIWLNWTTK